ncbi:hypothetical protein Lalb_Chr25g0286641 [Lupinus albus]|uniref:Uncharacterized protein n=1 Tax=Lupinus albus TaxID=3870 RepID=A0A6A4NEW8_LUPAL|nr:hypothetical protein Lalb_Chr25g0286641 [Lupinus albus]
MITIVAIPKTLLQCIRQEMIQSCYQLDCISSFVVFKKIVDDVEWTWHFRSSDLTFIRLINNKLQYYLYLSI